MKRNFWIGIFLAVAVLTALSVAGGAGAASTPGNGASRYDAIVSLFV